MTELAYPNTAGLNVECVMHAIPKYYIDLLNNQLSGNRYIIRYHRHNIHSCL